MPRGRPPSADVLTPAEWRVVEAVRHGLTNGQIASRQGFSLNAVKFHVSNALSKLGLKDRRALRHWTGVAQSSALIGKAFDMKLGAIGQISRSVSDITAATRWYGEVLGFTHLYSFDTLAFFDCAGTRLFLSQGEAKPESILYFRVGHIHAAHQHLSERGVVFVSAPHMIHRHEDGTEEWMAFFNDLEGRPLAIMAQAKPNA